MTDLTKVKSAQTFSDALKTQDAAVEVMASTNLTTSFQYMTAIVTFNYKSLDLFIDWVKSTGAVLTMNMQRSRDQGTTWYDIPIILPPASGADGTSLSPPHELDFDETKYGSPTTVRPSPGPIMIPNSTHVRFGFKADAAAGSVQVWAKGGSGI